MFSRGRSTTDDYDELNKYKHTTFVVRGTSKYYFKHMPTFFYVKCDGTRIMSHLMLRVVFVFINCNKYLIEDVLKKYLQKPLNCLKLL